VATAVVTGANRGIGLELARQLRARGREVMAVCRHSSPELEALGVRVEAGVDVSDDASVRSLADHVLQVDLLINNAAILSRQNLDDLDFQRILREIDVNALGALRVTAALLPRLIRGAKVALITSRMGSIADNSSGGRYGYRMSKSALNMAGRSLAIDLRARGIAVAILHPGFVRTPMTEHQGDIDAATAASRLLERIDELSMESSGRFWHASGQELPW
jgi:NAD(P)-dependent dehydrogenase (short-subunit alcohol dehydrogenase family)